MSRQSNFIPTPGVGLGLGGLNKKRKRFDDFPGDDDHVQPPAAATTTNGSPSDAPNDEDVASEAPPLPEEVSNATVRLIEAMQFQVHALTEKVARVDSLERRCRYLEERCTCRYAGTWGEGDDVGGANGGAVGGASGEHDAIDDGGAAAASEGGIDAAEASTRALLRSMEKPLENIRQKSGRISALERRCDILEERRMGRPSIPPPANNNNNHGYPHDHHYRLHSLEERCRFLEAKLHVMGPPPDNRTMPPPPGGREGGVTPPNASIPHPYGLDIIRAQEEAILLTIDDYKKMNRWPLRRNKADIFERDEKLQRLRLFESRRLRHERVKFDKAEVGDREGEEEKKEGKPEEENEKQIEGFGKDRCNNDDDDDDEKSSNNPNNILKSTSTSKSNERKEKVNKQGIKSCALCASKKCSRKVRWKCGLCQIPLCTKKNKNGLKSCWEIWHTEVDWKEERARVQRELVEKRTRKRGRGGGKEGNGDGDGDEDSDGEDEEEGEGEEGNEKGQHIDEESVVHV